MAESQPAGQFYDAFISYGRADSREFADSLRQHFVEQGYRIWFDANDIPLGVDFQNQIDDGIVRAHNFLFLISPHSINSDYCLREIKQALRFNKRIIPVLHVEKIDQTTWQRRNPGKTEVDWQQAKAAGKHSCRANMHPTIRKINWVYCREGQDDIEIGFSNLKNIFDRHRDYVFQHTALLNKALEWQRLQKQSRYLLIQSERQQAESWLKTKFSPDQPPCTPTDLHCELITESIQNASNLRTQAFLAHADDDRIKTDRVRRSLLREGITVWTSRADIKTGSSFQQEINRGIEEADNLIYLISPQAIESAYCQQEVNYALSLNKRVIPVLIEPTSLDEVPKEHRTLQFIDVTEKDVQQSSLDKLLNILKDDASYHNHHSRLLVRAIRWKQQDHNESLLLRGYNLRNAEAWLKTANTHNQYGPTDLQTEFIQASLHRPADESLDVFVSYSRADSDFTRNLNNALQTQGKTTWFDQENIDPGADFQQEIYRGIATSDNFLFVISPSSVSSPYCNDEVDYACKLNKRIITVLHRLVDPADLHPKLAQVQWIDFNQHEGEFYPNFSQVIRTIEYDREHVRNHTKWSQRALEWEQRDRTEDLLLRGSELTLANTWFEAQAELSKQPAATSLLKTFITACVDLQKRIEQEREDRRLKDLRQARRIALGTTVAGVVMTGLSFVAVYQARLAKIGQIENLLVASQAHFEAEQPFEALLTSLEGNVRLKELWRPDEELRSHADAILRQMTHAVQETDRLTGYPYGIIDVSFSPDGRYVALVGLESWVDLWDLDTRTLKSLEIKNSLDGSDSYIELISVDFSQDGHQLALADTTGNAYLYDLTGAQDLIQFQAHREEITQIRYSPDGKHLATASLDDAIHIWTLQGQPVRSLNHHQNDIWSLDFGPGGQQLVTASEDKTVHLMDFDGNAIIPPIQHNEAAITANISHDGGSLATAFWPATVKLWNLNDSKQSSEQSPIEWSVDEFGKGGIQSLHFSPNNQHLITATESGALELWDTAGNLIDTFIGHQEPINQISLSPNGQYLISGSDDGTARLWQVKPNPFRHVHKPNDLGVVGIDFSSDSGYLITEDSLTLHLWDLYGNQLAKLAGSEQGIAMTQTSIDGQTVATLSKDGKAALWQLSAGTPKSLASPQLSDDIMYFTLSANGDYLATRLPTETTQLWSVTEPQTQLLFEREGIDMDLSDNGQTMANLTIDGGVELFDTQGNLKTSFMHPEPIDPNKKTKVRLSPDGQVVATWSGMDIYLWDAAGTSLTTLEIPSLAEWDNIFQVSLSPDGQWLAATTETDVYVGTISGDTMTRLPHPAGVNELEFSLDSQQLLTLSDEEDGTARVWQVDTPQTLLTRSCQWITPYLQNLTNQNLDNDPINPDLCRNITSRQR